MNSGDLLLLLPTLLAMLSFPLVSSHLTGASMAVLSQEFSLTEINASAFPKETMLYTGESLRKSVRTPFGFYFQEQSFNRTLELLETSGGRISVESSFSYTLITVETPKGRISILQTPTLVEENFSSELGWQRRVLENGGLSIEKFARDEELLNARYEEVNATLFSLLEKLVKLRSSLWITKLKVTSPEFVELRNADEISINLSGYVLFDAAGNEFSFPQLELKSGECIRIYSGYSSCNETQGIVNDERVTECKVLCWKSSSVWNSDGDRAELRDGIGRLISFCEYKKSDVREGMVTC